MASSWICGYTGLPILFHFRNLYRAYDSSLTHRGHPHVYAPGWLRMWICVVTDDARWVGRLRVVCLW